MEPMRPVDVGPQAPPKPWWQRWGWRIYAAMMILLLVALQLTVDISFWAGVSIAVGLSIGWMVIESVLLRISAANAETGEAREAGPGRRE
ncbi:MAG TPA: hypothetical protein H9755_07135 [Candidatus Dietzia intestinigallinarum]|nr:hypothetical protein [Candidatus Dietzia intestinigallinarum]